MGLTTLTGTPSMGDIQTALDAGGAIIDGLIGATGKLTVDNDCVIKGSGVRSGIVWTSFDLATSVTQVNELKADYNAHRVLTAGSVHGAADSANTVISDNATDEATAITLANELRLAYAAHRVLTAGSVHGAADSANTVTVGAATNQTTLEKLVEALRVAYEAHRALTTAGVHGAADNTNAMTSAEYVGLDIVGPATIKSILRDVEIYGPGHGIGVAATNCRLDWSNVDVHTWARSVAANKYVIDSAWRRCFFDAPLSFDADPAVSVSVCSGLTFEGCRFLAKTLIGYVQSIQWRDCIWESISDYALDIDSTYPFGSAFVVDGGHVESIEHDFLRCQGAETAGLLRLTGMRVGSCVSLDTYDFLVVDGARRVELDVTKAPLYARRYWINATNCKAVHFSVAMPEDLDPLPIRLDGVDKVCRVYSDIYGGVSADFKSGVIRAS